VNKVFVYDKDFLKNPIAENITKILVEKQNKENYTHIMAPATAIGKKCYS